MSRSLAAFAAASLLASFASAQCYATNFGTLAGAGDDLLFTTVPMNISFPINGTSAAFTHAQISSNGVIFLSTGAAPVGTTNSGYPSQTQFQGAAGECPRIAPMWIDLDTTSTGGVYYDNSTPGVFVVTWANTTEWNVPSPIFTVQAQLFSNGNVLFSYSNQAATTLDPYTGISGGNGIATVPGVDLSVGPNVSATDLIYELQPTGVFDLNGTLLTFVRNGAAGYTEVASSCNFQQAYHENYGSGCYAISDSFYQFLPDSSTAPATLNGQSMVMTPVGPNYLMQWGGGTYIPPSGSATLLAMSDDSETTVTPSAPLPTPSGAVSPLFVHANGMISHASNNGISPNSYQPDVDGFLNAPATGFFAWHDYNVSEGGQILYEEVAVSGSLIACVTFVNVESYPGGVVNPSTLQFQMNLSTGTVTIVWVTVDGNTTSIYGSAHLIGWGPIGASIDGGNLNLATAAPFVTSTLNVPPLALNASPAPISGPGSGTVVTYSTTDMPEFAPGAGVYIGMNVLSVNQVPSGLDLSFIGAPGCSAYVGTLDFTQTMVGISPSNSVTLTLPPGLPAGTIIYSQSVSLLTPNSLPNGQNAFGMTTSNGVKSYISPF